MAKGANILIGSDPRGRFEEVVLDAAYYPGTVLMIKLGGTVQGGRLQATAYAPSASGDPRTICILLDNQLTGATATTQIASGTLAQVYYPMDGDNLNVLVKALAGTASANLVTIGERFEPETGSGKLIAQVTSGSRAPFTCMQRFDTTVDADTLVWMQYGSF